MHIQARDFTIFIKNILNSYFINKKVLDVGAGDINGNNRFLFENCDYQANDVINAQNITIVSKTKDLPFENEIFDTIISTECFEHDPEYKESFKKIYDMLKPNGLFCFTCASYGRAEHGTRRTTPHDSYGTIGNLEDMQDYYKNLTILDLNEVLNLNELFFEWESYYNSESFDLYFVGIKKGENFNKTLQKYSGNLIESTSHKINNLYSLDNIFDKYDTDKNSFFHNYTRQYEELLKNYRDKPVKYLEIGVYNGGSLNAFREYFSNGECLVGLDIDTRCKEFENSNKNIFVEIGNAIDKSFIESITQKYGAFDVILDDGGHSNSDVIQSFELLFPLLNDNGLYIVEDTICYKVGNYINNSYPNHLQYFCNYIPFLNQWRYDSTEGTRDNCIDPFKILKKTENVFEYSIDKIEFGCSYIAIHKKIRHHWIK
jgi:SAM-dependent methyltransferase